MDSSNYQKPSSSEIQIEQSQQAASSLKIILLVATIAAGVQFGWALQLSLLTPYSQHLGVSHFWSSFIWFCGPISGMLVQPAVGYYSDRCTSKFGRRSPFIASGAALVAVAVFLIGYAADIGYKFGDDLNKTMKPRAVCIFVLGFWIMDVANNTLQGPCRALLADLSGNDPKRMRLGNFLFAFFMGLGNILGYAAGSYAKLYLLFPFSVTKACDLYCANLKSCFFIGIILLASLTIIALSIVREIPLDKAPQELGIPVIGELVGFTKEMDKQMWMLILVTALNWIGWFPFLLYQTDFMGREVFGGDPKMGTAYDAGVRSGSLGLMLQSVVLSILSLCLLEPISRMIGARATWGIANIILAICLAMTVFVSKASTSYRHLHGITGFSTVPPENIKAYAIAIFAVLGIPQAVTYSIPFALASIFSKASGHGQGLSLGVLNIFICIPQLLVAGTAGLIDEMFGGGNLPAFVAGAIASAISGILALTLLPKPPSNFSSANTAPHL